MEFNVNSSTVQRLDFKLFSDRKIEVFMKRDDLIHPFVSGNKWRKLKYVVAEAARAEKKHLVSYGGAFSNHLLALACAGAVLGFKTTGFIRGEELSPPNHVLFLCRQYGMNLIYVTREKYRDKQRLFDSYFGGDPEVFNIEEGGYSPFALEGCAEVLEQLDRVFDFVYTPVGTGTTLCGLAYGALKYGTAKRVEGIAVLKDNGYLDLEIERLSPGLGNWHVHRDYHGGGYGKTTPELFEFMSDFTRSNGILLDPVYTGKMLMAVFDLAEKGHFPPGTSVLALHTGGLLGAISEANIKKASACDAEAQKRKNI